MPSKMEKRIDKLRQEFLWKGRKQIRTFSLVKWSTVIDSKERGLGVKNLRRQIKSLLMKCPWRFTVEEEALWRKFCSSKVWKPNWIVLRKEFTTPMVLVYGGTIENIGHTSLRTQNTWLLIEESYLSGMTTGFGTLPDCTGQGKDSISKQRQQCLESEFFRRNLNDRRWGENQISLEFYPISRGSTTMQITDIGRVMVMGVVLWSLATKFKLTPCIPVRILGNQILKSKAPIKVVFCLFAL